MLCYADHVIRKCEGVHLDAELMRRMRWLQQRRAGAPPYCARVIQKRLHALQRTWSPVRASYAYAVERLARLAYTFRNESAPFFDVAAMAINVLHEFLRKASYVDDLSSTSGHLLLLAIFKLAYKIESGSDVRNADAMRVCDSGAAESEASLTERILPYTITVTNATGFAFYRVPTVAVAVQVVVAQRGVEPCPSDDADIAYAALTMLRDWSFVTSMSPMEIAEAVAGLVFGGVDHAVEDAFNKACPPDDSDGLLFIFNKSR